MALIIKTNTPSGLLTEIKKAIDAKKIDTWSYDSDGDFTHTPDQWRHKAWFRVVPTQNVNELQFGIVGQQKVNTTTVIYAVYHGRFAEMLLSHFDSDFTEVKATAMPTSADSITQIK
jgi:hypothetical protein